MDQFYISVYICLYICIKIKRRQLRRFPPQLAAILLQSYGDMSTLFWTYLNRTIYLMVYDSSVAEKNLLKVNG